MGLGETWITVGCAKCETINWVCLGDFSDFSKMDYESFKCFDCAEVQWLNTDVDPLDRDAETLEDAYCTDGKESSSV